MFIYAHLFCILKFDSNLCNVQSLRFPPNHCFRICSDAKYLNDAQLSINHILLCTFLALGEFLATVPVRHIEEYYV